jgi:hypothetical protein
MRSIELACTAHCISRAGSRHRRTLIQACQGVGGYNEVITGRDDHLCLSLIRRPCSITLRSYMVTAEMIMASQIANGALLRPVYRMLYLE